MFKRFRIAPRILFVQLLITSFFGYYILALQRDFEAIASAFQGTVETLPFFDRDTLWIVLSCIAGTIVYSTLLVLNRVNTTSLKGKAIVSVVLSTELFTAWLLMGLIAATLSSPHVGVPFIVEQTLGIGLAVGFILFLPVASLILLLLLLPLPSPPSHRNRGQGSE